MRCTKANRACSGYEKVLPSKFQQYEAHGLGQSLAFVSSARKCSLPKRTADPGTGFLPEDNLPAHVSAEMSNTLALRAFFYDYCVTSTNKNLSRGYLSGLEMLTQRLGPQSNLVKACQAVSLASHGKPLKRPRIVQLSEAMYHELLSSFAGAIQDPEVAKAVDTRLVVMLLGLYEVCFNLTRMRMWI